MSKQHLAIMYKNDGITEHCNEDYKITLNKI